MKKYKVFIDTNIYDASNFKFNNKEFEILYDFVKLGMVEILINSVIDVEVMDHIRNDVNKAVKKVNEAISERIFANFHDDEEYNYKTKFWDKKQIREYLENKFINFKKDFNVKNIDINGINLEQVMLDYLNKKYPFEQSKPNEFKDAIAIESILNYYNLNNDDGSLCVISNDNGFRKAICEKNNNILVFNKLSEFIERLSAEKSTIIINSINEYILETDLNDEFKSKIKEIAENITYIKDELESDVYVNKVYDIRYKINYTNIKDKYAFVGVEAKFCLDILGIYIDGEKSIFDNEDKEYIWKTEIEVEENYNICIDCVFKLDLNEFVLSKDNEDSIIEIIEVTDQPKYINLSEQELIYENIIYDSSKDFEEEEEIDGYTTCPFCGCVINENNDEANGFCSGCGREY